MKSLVFFLGFTSYALYYFTNNFTASASLDMEVLLHLFTGGVAFTVALRLIRYFISSEFFLTLKSIKQYGIRNTLMELFAAAEA